MKSDKTKTTTLKIGYVDRALKERMLAKFSEGDSDPKEWLAKDSKDVVGWILYYVD